MTAYYNEIDPFAAAWLRELIKAGMIAHGEVDERSIEDVVPTDLLGFTQCHFFAGIGVWSYALRQAGWPDDRPVWTGSCPCQPFSVAGKGKGTADERHLWPEFARLIGECSPATVFGEQVAAKAGRAWLNDVRLDLEALGYAVGASDLCAAGFGAPHIRQRLYWVGHAVQPGLEGHAGHGDNRAGRKKQDGPVAETGTPCGLADSQRDEEHQEQQRPAKDERERSADGTRGRGMAREGWTGPTNGHWRDADWLLCRDGKWRAVEPGTFPLVAGMPRSMGALGPWLRGLAEMAGLSAASLKRAKSFRVGSLRGYGNAINAQQAQAFIETAIAVLPT